MELQTLITLAGILVSVGALYGALRVELRELRRRVDEVKEDIGRIHDRIDVLIKLPEFTLRRRMERARGE